MMKTTTIAAMLTAEEVAAIEIAAAKRETDAERKAREKQAIATAARKQADRMLADVAAADPAKVDRAVAALKRRLALEPDGKLNLGSGKVAQAFSTFLSGTPVVAVTSAAARTGDVVVDGLVIYTRKAYAALAISRESDARRRKIDAQAYEMAYEASLFNIDKPEPAEPAEPAE